MWINVWKGLWLADDSFWSEGRFAPFMHRQLQRATNGFAAELFDQLKAIKTQQCITQDAIVLIAECAHPYWARATFNW